MHLSSEGQIPCIPVVIPYFRASTALQRCLKAIESQIGVTTKIYVRDNSEDNILFTKAVNEGLRKFAYENNSTHFILVLNQDAYLRPESLQNMVGAMEGNPKAGIVIPVAVNEDNQVTSFAALNAYPWGISRGGDMKDVPKTAYCTYWANGACMLLRVSMIREIGLLDENMRFICSDADYSFTARSRGWEVMVEPSSVVEHSLNASGQSSNAWLEDVKLSDQFYFAQKWLSAELYRALSFEGKSLSDQFIREEMNKTLHQVSLLRQNPHRANRW